MEKIPEREPKIVPLPKINIDPDRTPQSVVHALDEVEQTFRRAKGIARVRKMAKEERSMGHSAMADILEGEAQNIYKMEKPKEKPLYIKTSEDKK